MTPSIRLLVEQNYGRLCPCCGIRMITPKIGVHNPDNRTRAHIHPSGHPDRNDGHWFYACLQCNGDQGGLSLDEWWLILAYRGDARQKNVLALMRLLAGKAGIRPKAAQAFFEAIEEAAQAAISDLRAA